MVPPEPELLVLRVRHLQPFGDAEIRSVVAHRPQHVAQPSRGGGSAVFEARDSSRLDDSDDHSSAEVCACGGRQDVSGSRGVARPRRVPGVPIARRVAAVWERRLPFNLFSRRSAGRPNWTIQGATAVLRSVRTERQLRTGHDHWTNGPSLPGAHL